MMEIGHYLDAQKKKKKRHKKGRFPPTGLSLYKDIRGVTVPGVRVHRTKVHTLLSDFDFKKLAHFDLTVILS